MEVTGKSKILFVLAHPVGHVRASHVFNTHFNKTGKNAAAVPLHVILMTLHKSRNPFAKWAM